MVHDDYGWSCPQCGSVIIDSSKGEADRREQASAPPVRAAGGALHS
jgi:hypothetical protein